MDITGTCSDGKESLLTQDYNLSLPQYRTYPRRSRCLDSLHVILTFICVVTCVISCICAVYCHNAAAEEKTVQHVETAKSGISAPLVAPTDASAGISAPLVAPTDASDLSQAVNDNSFEPGVEYDDYLEWDDSEMDEYDGEGDEDDLDEGFGGDEYDLDGDVDGSGVSDEAGFSDYLDQTDHVRERRSASRCIGNCQKRKTGGKQKKCIKKCQRGGGKTQSINLPAAHFVVNLSEEEIPDLVRVEYSSYVNKDVPLRIFKPAEWVDKKSSPVTFKDSVVQAKSAGIYLVYAQAYIGGKQPEKSITVVQKRKGTEINALSCNNGVHPDHFDSLSGQMQTCSVSGLINVQAGDHIEIQKSAATADIVLDKDKTYFGIIQLNGNRKTKTNSKN